MAEMKNICGKIPMDLHEKVREEIELTESSTQKFLQQVIEEHFNRVEGKGEISMGAVRTVAVQVSEELFQRLKVVIGKKHMKQKDFLIQIIEEALEKVEVECQIGTRTQVQLTFKASSCHIFLASFCIFHSSFEMPKSSKSPI